VGLKLRLTSASGFDGLPFRAALRRELAARCGRNPQYSLRSFAAHLGIDNATLSQLLRGKRPLTARTIETLGTALGFDAAAIATFQETEKLPHPAAAAEESARRLAADAAIATADWWHEAILELVRLEDFRPDSRWIARVLDLSVDDVNVALQRLVRLGLLEMQGERWVDRSGPLASAFEDLGVSALERLWREVATLAASSVAERLRGDQDHTAITIAVDSRRIPAAIERISRFRRELIELLEDPGDRDDVYRLEIRLYPVTKTRG